MATYRFVGVSLFHVNDHSLFAACMFIVAAVKRPDVCTGIMKSELSNPNANSRSGAIARFYALWRSRYHCWLKMEEGAHVHFKVKFTLPCRKKYLMLK